MTTNPAAALTSLQTRILAALRTRATPTPEGLRVKVSPIVLSQGLAVLAETTARALAGLEKAGYIARAPAAVAPAANRESMDQDILLIGTAAEAALIVTRLARADVDHARGALASAIRRLSALQPDDGTLLREVQVQHQAVMELHQRIPRQGFGLAASAPAAAPAGGKEA